jgi:hypothetical protein
MIAEKDALNQDVKQILVKFSSVALRRRGLIGRASARFASIGTHIREGVPAKVGLTIRPYSDKLLQPR